MGISFFWPTFVFKQLRVLAGDEAGKERQTSQSPNTIIRLKSINKLLLPFLPLSIGLVGSLGALKYFKALKQNFLLLNWILFHSLKKSLFLHISFRGDWIRAGNENEIKSQVRVAREREKNGNNNKTLSLFDDGFKLHPSSRCCFYSLFFSPFPFFFRDNALLLS